MLPDLGQIRPTSDHVWSTRGKDWSILANAQSTSTDIGPSLAGFEPHVVEFGPHRVDSVRNSADSGAISVDVGWVWARSGAEGTCSTCAEFGQASVKVRPRVVGSTPNWPSRLSQIWAHLARTRPYSTCFGRPNSSRAQAANLGNGRNLPELRPHLVNSVRALGVEIGAHLRHAGGCYFDRPNSCRNVALGAEIQPRFGQTWPIWAAIWPI